MAFRKLSDEAEEEGGDLVESSGAKEEEIDADEEEIEM
jgi:hypothetical protein